MKCHKRYKGVVKHDALQLDDFVIKLRQRLRNEVDIFVGVLGTIEKHLAKSKERQGKLDVFLAV